MHPIHKQADSTRSPAVVLAASVLRADAEKLNKQAEAPRVTELQRRLDREAEQLERWDGLS